MAKKPTGPPALAGRRRPTPVVVAVRRKRANSDTVTLEVRVSKTDWMRLQQLAMSEETSMQALAREGLARVFAEHGLSSTES